MILKTFLLSLFLSYHFSAPLPPPPHHPAAAAVPHSVCVFCLWCGGIKGGRGGWVGGNESSLVWCHSAQEFRRRRRLRWLAGWGRRGGRRGGEGGLEAREVPRRERCSSGEKSRAPQSFDFTGAKAEVHICFQKQKPKHTHKNTYTHKHTQTQTNWVQTSRLL